MCVKFELLDGLFWINMDYVRQCQIYSDPKYSLFLHLRSPQSSPLSISPMQFAMHKLIPSWVWKLSCFATYVCDLWRLLRNRVSAQQARERKKAYLTDLEVKVKNLEKKNSEIEEKLSTLQNENQMLRQVHFALSMYLARKICLFDDLNSVDFVWDLLSFISMFAPSKLLLQRLPIIWCTNGLYSIWPCNLELYRGARFFVCDRALVV